MELIDRKTALNKGLARYFTGQPCKRGHVAERKVGNGCCTECAKQLTRNWRTNGSKPKDDYNPCGKEIPNQDYLRECFDYIFETGQLVWLNRPDLHFASSRAGKIFNGRFSGKVAGHYHTRNGYLEVRLDGKLYKGHRIIWKLLTGEDPENMLDHIDGDVSNNKIENLRIANAQENARNGSKRPKKANSTSVYKGVGLTSGGKWASYITVGDKPFVKEFKTELEAALDYDKRALEIFGEFAKLNFPEGTADE